MADAPKAQRRRRRQRSAGNASSTPTADTSPSGPSTQTVRRRRRGRRVRRSRVPRSTTATELVVTRAGPTRRGLTRAIKRELKREGIDGPKVSVQQKITATFGLIKPNTTGNTELELNFFLHPALAKEANDGSAFGPLQALAAQYSLWKLKHLAIRFTPMVGASAVSGTVVRVSLNLSQSPGVSNWSGLGARLHMDMHPGQTSTFYLRGDQVAGPRDGGWWFTDTNEEGSQSAGPIVEIHTMGLTRSTFRNEDWTGPLFLVEGIGMWQFANYNVKPALGSLERREGTSKVEIRASASQPITMVMNSADTIAQFMDAAEPEIAAVPTGQAVGETIFQVIDVGAKIAQNISPPPFGWLIKGGWWFVKKLLGKARDGTSEFVVYASLQDAQNNKPAVASSSLTGLNQQTTDLMVTQINSPNVGPNPYGTATPRAGPQILRPGETFKVSSEMITELFARVSDKSGQVTAVPVSLIPGILRYGGTGGKVPYPTTGTVTAQPLFIQTPWWVGAPGMAPGENGLIPAEAPDTEYRPTPGKGGYIHALYRLHDPRFTDQSGVFEFLPPEGTENSPEFAVLHNFGGGVFTPDTSNPGKPPIYTPGNGEGSVTKSNPYLSYGKVVATSHIFAGTTPALDMVFSLIRITKSFAFGRADNVRDMLVAIGTTTNQVKITLVPKESDPSLAGNNTWNILERDVPVDTYLLGVGFTNTSATANGADITTMLQIKDAYSRVESTFSPIFPYNLVGQMLPATSVDIKMKYIDYHPPSDELIQQLEVLRVPYTLPSHSIEESGKPGPSLGGEGGEVCVPCVLPPVPPSLPPIDEDDESCSDDDDVSSVERFLFEIGNEMIELPKKWLDDPEFSRFLDM